MSVMNYENNLIEAIQTIVDHAVSNAQYDKTIQATIVKAVDPTVGKYMVKYQDSVFFAYSQSTESVYAKGTNVYVLVPGNDMSQDKTIVGAVDKLGVDYVNDIQREDAFEQIGANIIKNQAQFALCSYEEQSVKVLYDKEQNINLIELNEFDAEQYIKNASYILCGANFRTTLDSEQKFKGNYGIAFELSFKSGDSEEENSKTYIIDINNMVGDPYNLSPAVRQYDTFEIDGESFSSINRIYIFQYDFPNTDIGQKDDIFVSKIELFGVNKLSQNALDTCALTFYTPDGIYFNDNDSDSAILRLDAQVRIRGRVIDADSQDTQYYWFRENNAITVYSNKYNNIGGAGWECLNPSNIVSTADIKDDHGDKIGEQELVEWAPMGYEYQIKKENNIANKTTYKCVAVYNKNTVISKEITIYNYSSPYTITIESDMGSQFYFNVGNPNLVCKVNGKEDEIYSFSWGVVNSHNMFSILPNTIEENEEYNEAAKRYDEIMLEVAAEKAPIEYYEDELEECLTIIQKYKKIQRVERNRIYALNVAGIENFSTYKCSVFKGEIYIGTAAITIKNSMENTADYILNVNNGTQVFGYNEAGVAPNNESLEKPMVIQPLSFTLYDEQGNEVPLDALDKNQIEWHVPKKNTMIYVQEGYGEPAYTTEDSYVYKGTPTLGYNISQRFFIEKSNNRIKLMVTYKHRTITAHTDFSFIKQGDPGTNGTEFICKIVPNTLDRDFDEYPMVTYDRTTETAALNYYCPVGEENKWFKVQLWHNGINIFEQTESGFSNPENQEVKVQWRMLKTNYAGGVTENSNFAVEKDTGVFSINKETYTSPANIVQCIVEYLGYFYYATLPIIYTEVKSTTQINIKQKKNSGFRYVTYSSGGDEPLYDNTMPFELEIQRLTEQENGETTMADVSTWSSGKERVFYDWHFYGESYNGVAWQDDYNLEDAIIANTTTKRNQRYFKPTETYDGRSLSNGILCNILTEEQENLGIIWMPIHLSLNRYGNKDLNQWDGNNISLKEDGGIILSPQVGAGVKHQEDNTFSGIFMGKVQDTDGVDTETGLFAYSHGERTIELNAETGVAAFGKQGAGRIYIDPSSNIAQIYSGNYVEKDEENKIEGSGMMIDLTTPEIKFGNESFIVNDQGVHLKNYTKEEDVTRMLGETLVDYSNTDATKELIETTIGEKVLDENGDTLAHRMANMELDYRGFKQTVSTAGGYNLLYYDTDFWNIADDSLNNGLTSISERAIEIDEMTIEEYKVIREEIESAATSGKGYYFTGPIKIYQKVLVPNPKVSRDYHLSFKYRSYGILNNAITTIFLNDEATTLESDGQWHTFEKICSVPGVEGGAAQEIIISIACSGADSQSQFLLADGLFVEGSVLREWTQNPNETRTDTVKIGKGIQVESSTTNTYTRIDSDGNRIYNKATGKETAVFTDKGIDIKQKNGILRTPEAEIGIGQLTGDNYSKIVIQTVGNQIWISGVLGTDTYYPGEN